jgi:hypothetical protein
MLDKKKREPADECDLQTGGCIGRIEARDEPGQCIIDDDCGEDCKEVGADIMRPVDVRHRPGMKIEPFFAEDCVPAVADELMNNDENPDSEMMDLAVHEVANYPAIEALMKADCRRGTRRGERLFILPVQLAPAFDTDAATTRGRRGRRYNRREGGHHS